MFHEKQINIPFGTKNEKIPEEALMWGKKTFSELSEDVKKIWEERCPNEDILEGREWEGESYPGLYIIKRGGYEGDKIPFKLLKAVSGLKEDLEIIFSRVDKWSHGKERELWETYLSHTQNIHRLNLSFLEGDKEIGRVELSSGSSSEVPREFIDKSDRFLILKRKKEKEMTLENSTAGEDA